MKEPRDEMDLSRDAAADAAEEPQAMHCPFDAGEPVTQWVQGDALPWRVFCKECFCSTPQCRLRNVAVSIWNRRVARKSARLIDKRQPPEHTPPRNPRSSGRSSAAGKRATGRKGAQSKSKES